MAANGFVVSPSPTFFVLAGWVIVGLVVTALKAAGGVVLGFLSAGVTRVEPPSASAQAEAPRASSIKSRVPKPLAPLPT